MKIEIKILNNSDEVIARSETLSFESATEDLGRLERYCENTKCTRCGEPDELVDGLCVSNCKDDMGR